MTVDRKRGALSSEDMDFIRANVATMDPAIIAAHLNRNPEPVIRFIARNRVGKTFEELRGEAEKTEQQIFQQLKTKTFYKNLKEQLSVAELDYFADHWVALVLQFNGDLAASEEMELKELLILEILKNRESASEYFRMQQLDQLHSQIRDEMKQPRHSRDQDLINSLSTQASQIKVASSTYVRNFKDLCDRADKMRKALHASRQDRVKHLENAKVDFVAFLRLLEEHGERLKVGKEMEVIRTAKDKEQRRLASLHTFSDGKVDRPILTSETIHENSS